MSHEERSSGVEYAKPITLIEDVWMGDSAVIRLDVTIGNCTIIGAGSVVTRDSPSAVFAANNTCRVIRQLKD